LQDWKANETGVMLVIAVDVVFITVGVVVIRDPHRVVRMDRAKKRICLRQKDTAPSLSRISLGNCLFSLSQALLYLFKPAKI
jgi:hypothetical protein